MPTYQYRCLNCSNDLMIGTYGQSIDRQDRSILAGSKLAGCNNMLINTVFDLGTGKRYIPSPDGVTIGLLPGYRPRANKTYGPGNSGRAYYEELSLDPGAVDLSRADALLDADEAERFAASLPQAAAPVEGEDSHEGARPLGLAGPRGGRADDLKLIRGVGRQNEQRLHALGVWHFDQIASWKAKDIAFVDGKMERFMGMIPREPYALSRNPSVMGKPKFADSVFSRQDGAVIELELR